MAGFTDPLLRLLPSEPPDSFMVLSPAEQSWRGRIYLMTWSLGGTDAASWAMALHDEPEHVTEMKNLALRADDEDIRSAVQDRIDEDRSIARRGLN